LQEKRKFYLTLFPPLNDVHQKMKTKTKMGTKTENKNGK